jgi:glycerophosphoryl diester phosphodiesterase
VPDTADRLPPYLDTPRPLAMAHRGGATYPPNLGLENTMAAFRRAVEHGYRYLETDVRATRDGVPVLVHDRTLRRLAGRPEAVADLSWVDLQRYRIDGREPVATLPELLAAFPAARLNIDVKSDDALAPTLAAVRAAGAEDRVCLASFSDRRIRRIRRLAGPRIATSCSAWEVTLLLVAPARRVRATGRRRGASSVQVPRRSRGVRIISERFVARAHEVGLQVHVWTIDDEQTIRGLLDLGVDGLITDRIDVLRDVLSRLGETVP